VTRREETETVRTVTKMNVEKKREREGPKMKRLGTIDMRDVGACVGYVKNQDKWRSRTRVPDRK